MISRTPGTRDLARAAPDDCAELPPPGDWRHRLARAVTDPAELLELLELPAELLAGARRGAADFPLRVPRELIARMAKGDPRDPLLAQVLPLGEELTPVPGFSADPLAEADAGAAPAVLHKYHGRLLLLAAGGCAVNCRYCFRRHFPYAEHRLDGEAMGRALAYIAGEPSVREVILSGGDPLLAADAQLAELAAQLAAIPHLRRLRIHTRLPVVLPQRVDGDLLAWLTGGRLTPVVVLHVNHANEIDGAVARATAALARRGVTLLNQTVLLAGVNDSAEVLAELSEALFEVGVLPYYLHLLDRVAGAAHFEVDEARARCITRRLTARLPGYLVPRLVREVPGAAGKQAICLDADPSP